MKSDSECLISRFTRQVIQVLFRYETIMIQASERLYIVLHITYD